MTDVPTPPSQITDPEQDAPSTSDAVVESVDAPTPDAEEVVVVEEEGEPSPPLRVLHLTKNWIAVDKPAGMLMHRTKLYPSRRGERFLVNDVRDYMAKKLNRRVPIFPVHRLDRPTTGVVIFGLDEARNAAMIQEALQKASAQKQYWTLAFGAEMEEKWINENPLKDIKGHNRKQRNARTDFERLASFPTANVAVVRATLATGRRHQIRRHLDNSRYPVVGDTSHGNSKLNHAATDAYGVQRLCLHSRRLTFTDPFTSARVYLQVPVPDDLRDVLERIPGYSSELASELDLDDAEVMDTVLSEPGVSDAAETDTGVPDAAETDTGVPDAAETDTVESNAAVSDASDASDASNASDVSDTSDAVDADMTGESDEPDADVSDKVAPNVSVSEDSRVEQ